MYIYRLDDKADKYNNKFHRAIQFDWVNLFLDKNINEQVILFNGTILNIFHNLIPNKII